MLPRTLEVEVMDTPEEAADYDAMDHSAVNRLFAADFLAVWHGHGPVLDLGTGTAQIPIELCRQSSAISLIAVDLADHMLTLARRNVAAAGLAERIDVRKVDAKRLPFADASMSAIVSNSIVHHIPEPATCLAELVRVLAPGGVVFVRDLCRPAELETLRRLVEQYAGDATPHQRQMFDDSLHAALTVDEVRAIVAGLGFDPADVRATSDRHWTWQAVRA